MSWGNNRGRGNPQSVQKILDENAQLIQAIVDYQSKGKAAECVQYQQLLHKNLMHLAGLADSGQNIQGLLPPPPNSSPVSITSTAVVGGPSGMIPGNMIDRKGSMSTSMDQGSPGLPNITSQTVTQMSSGIAATMTNGSGENNMNFGGNANMASSSGTATGYPGNVNQMIPQNMAVTHSTMIQGQQQNYAANIHAQRGMQQGQQFMMQQGVNRAYSRPPIQMQQPQPHINQAYIGSQGMAGQTGTAGIMPYQQTNQSYDPYTTMQHVNAGYNNPYAPQ